MDKPHSSQLAHQTFDEVRQVLVDEQDFETAVELLFAVWPTATRDEIVDVLTEIEQVGES